MKTSHLAEPSPILGSGSMCSFPSPTQEAGGCRWITNLGLWSPVNNLSRPGLLRGMLGCTRNPLLDVVTQVPPRFGAGLGSHLFSSSHSPAPKALLSAPFQSLVVPLVVLFRLCLNPKEGVVCSAAHTTRCFKVTSKKRGTPQLFAVRFWRWS